MDAILSKIGGRYTLALERRLPHPPEKVWRALTEAEFLRQWFPADIKGKWEVGEALQFIFLHGEGEGLPDEEMRGEVLAFDPPRLLEFSWGTHILRSELVRDDSGCRLYFSETLADASWGARNAAGWEMCLQNLDLLLEGAAAAKFVVDVWKSRFAHYKRRFEPDAGPQQGMPENHPEAD